MEGVENSASHLLHGFEQSQIYICCNYLLYLEEGTKESLGPHHIQLTVVCAF